MPKINIAFALLFFAALFPVFGAAPAAKADTLAPKQEVLQTPDTTNRKHLGRLSIVSMPPKAEVIVDSIPKGECPVIVDSMAPGTHMIVVNGKGYFGKKVLVDALADTTVDVAVTLVAPADLVVLSDPVGATALIDGKGMGATPCDLPGLKPGDHALKLDKAGFISLEKQVVLTEAKTDTISVVLRPVGAASELPGGGNAPQQTNMEQSPTANSPPRQTESVGNMVQIQGGTFMAGFNDGASDENPKHQVKLSEFYMDKTDVTQAEYKRVMGTNPAQFKGDLTRPVEHVTWFDAILYCNARSKLEGKDTVYTYTAVARSGDTCTGLTGISSNMLTKGYRLPTEAEWEYACRAGSTTTYWWGADTNGMSARTWWHGNSSNITHPVATKAANAYGLFDMTGNVWEWCNDWYGEYRAGAVTNPTGSASGTWRVLRGGAWDCNYGDFRSAYRFYIVPASAFNFYSIGFRTTLPAR